MKTARSARSATAPALRWNTRHLYPSEAAWGRARRALRAALAGIRACRGTLAGGPAPVRRCLDRAFAAQRDLARLTSYAERRHDEDTRVARYQALREVAEKLATELLEACSFIEPELAALPEPRLRRLCQHPSLAAYTRFLGEVLRLRPHLLSAAEEALLARTSLLRETGQQAYATFCGADLVFPPLRSATGRGLPLTQALFPRYRAAPDRALRERAFSTYFGTFQRYRHTLAALLSAQVNANITFARARRYDTALAAALHDDELPLEVYSRTIAAAHEHLPLLHRYFRLRRRRLGVARLRYHDLYAPIVERASFHFPLARARETLQAALAPLGGEYAAVLAQALGARSGWIDLYPQPGKASGAYMDGSAYDVHPYVLGNYLDDFNSLSMLAHELGHALHSFFSNRAQPYPKAEYATFVAEVASTLNEILLSAHLRRSARTPRQRLFLLGEQLEGFRTTFFRQALFAEFELAIYERAEAGQALTADVLSAVYLRLLRKYHGHERGVVEVDERCAIEWACIPHFFLGFYVFQYATGWTAATALAEAIAREGAAASRRYAEALLTTGRSAPPLVLLARAGVDLTGIEPYRLAMAAFERALAEAEALAAGAKASRPPAIP
ncbi:MAG: oligoendopeptidase F family protein [Proteobacteria bacterium]|nr:oligoendopeptidase F family protein [Pseudomonadota bacterium]